MQHTLRTAIKNYSNGSVEIAREEFGDFLVKVHQTVVARDRKVVRLDERSTGACIEFNSPQSLVAAPPVQPDCKRGEGCLFCAKYRVHADEKDVRKLLSAKYLIEQTSKFATSAEEYERVFKVTLERIDQILNEIANADHLVKALIVTIGNEVAAGELDSFWMLKMEELMELEIL